MPDFPPAVKQLANPRATSRQQPWQPVILGHATLRPQQYVLAPTAPVFGWKANYDWLLALTCYLLCCLFKHNPFRKYNKL